ncbi:hypothetical protein MSG28_009923 [Choristoneura fumiferana]|uniref:Uncharacterized protein n=1 Tax=Choristoneura fumiferana TaxID=7141 RepID=A0ACC0JD50_CHOFU|nr:hypothetical protein MSG28_009923 [Choristoneura fumiferana]
MQQIRKSDKVLASGLPGGAVWARVERARGAAHWRPAGGAGRGGAADPQRAPEPADLADLLLPVADPDALLMLFVNALRLAKVPLLPSAGYVRAAAGGGGGGEWAGGEALLGALRAARRLPGAHPARPPPRAARRLVRAAADPPHYFGDEHGYRGWVDALWDAALASQLNGNRLRKDDPECAAEARRIRDSAQAALRQWGGAHPVPFALFARLAAAGGAGGRAARVALRAALQDAALPHHHLLYVARIVQEVCGGGGGELCAEGAWALAAAVLRRALPDDCERRCSELEADMEAREGEGEGEEEGEADAPGAALVAALLPGEAEWPPRGWRWRRLAGGTSCCGGCWRRAGVGSGAGEGAGRGARAGESSRRRRWRCVGGGAGGAGGALAREHPHNTLLQLMSCGTALWAPGAAGGAAGAAAGKRACWARCGPRCCAPPPPTGSPKVSRGDGARRGGVLGAVWPALLRAAATDWEPEATGSPKVSRATGRGGGGGGRAGRGVARAVARPASDWEPEASGVLARVLRRREGREGRRGALWWALRLERRRARPPAPGARRARRRRRPASPQGEGGGEGARCGGRCGWRRRPARPQGEGGERGPAVVGATAGVDDLPPTRCVRGAGRRHGVCLNNGATCVSQWLYVRAAALGGDSAALADALLERGLRLRRCPPSCAR